MEFNNYAQIQWEEGDATGGSDGLSGSYPARAGYASSSGSSFELNGSGVAGAFLDSNHTIGLIYNDLHSTTPGRYVFQFRGGHP